MQKPIMPGRVRIQPDLSIPGHPEIFVVGDTASLEQDGKPLPGVAQVAIQQGRYAADLIRRKVTGKPPLPPSVISTKETWRLLVKTLLFSKATRLSSAASRPGLSGPACICNSWVNPVFG